METDSTGRVSYSVRLNTDSMQRDADRAQKMLHDLGSSAVSEGDRIDSSLRKVGAAIGTYFAADKIKDFVVQVANVRGEFQQLEMAFTTMLGSADKADSLMNQLIKTAATTPFGMTDVANGAKQLLAYGVAANEVNETLIRLGDIAAGLSIPLNDLAYLYGTTMVQGRLYTQDLNQFLGRGIPLTEELAKQFGVSTSKVKELVTEGKVGFPEVKKAIEDMTNEGSRFGGLMEKQSQTITGQISNIEDSIEQMFNEIGKQQEGVISQGLGMVSKLIDNWQTIGKVLLTIIAAYGAYKAAVVAVWAAQKISAIWGAIQAFVSLAAEIRTAKDAMLLFNMACSANPLGVVLGILGAAAAAFSLFGENTSEAAQMSEKFGEKAATSISRVNTLATSLEGLQSGTGVYKKALEELNGILDEYGATQVKEGDNIDTINEKRAQAIELIKQEGIERQRLNALETGNDTYNQALTDAQASMQKALKNAMTSSNGIWVSENDELRENAEAISTIVSQIVEKDITLIAGKTGKEYQKGVDKIYKDIQDRMRAIGISENTISESWLTDNLFNHTNIIQNYIDAVQSATEAHDNYTDKVNKSAEAEQNAASKATTFSDRVKATEASLQSATDGVHGLYNNIKQLMQQYSDNTIGFHIQFDAEIPAWMSKIKLPELQRLAKFFTAVGKNSPKGAYVNGKFWSQQQLLQRGYDYGHAADQRQTANEKKQQEAEANAKANKKAADKAAKAAETRRKQEQDEAKRIADATAERNKQIRQYRDSVEEQTKQAELDIEQQRIENMEDGYEKSRKTVEIHYKRLTEENKKREEEMLKALADNRVNEWLNANPKATKTQIEAYRNSLTDKKSKTRLTAADLTKGQQDMLKAYSDIAEQIRVKELESVYGNGQQAMTDYLKEYGSFQEQKFAIAAEYAEKIKQVQNSSDTEEQKTWKIRSLREQQSKDEQQVEGAAIQAKIDWYQIFGNVGGIMKNVLQPILEDLKAFTRTDKFQGLAADQQKTIIDAINNLREQVGSNSDLGWQDLARDLTDYQTALKEARDALDVYTDQQEAFAPMIKAAQKKVADAISKGDKTAQDAGQKELDNLLAELADSGKAVTTANKKVSTSGQKLAQTTKGVMKPIDDIHTFLATTGLTQLQTVYDSINEIKGGFDALKALKEAGKDVKDLGDGVKDASKDLGDVGSKVADSIGEGLSKAGLIGQIIAAILKILDVLKDGIGTLISSLIDSILGAVNGILKNILSGKFISQIVGSVVKGIGGILDTVLGAVGSVLSFGALSSKGPSAWFTNSNAKKVAETTERLTTANEALQHSIDKLKDSIDKNYGGKALSDFQEALNAQKLRDQNLQEILNTQQNYHGHHHSNAHYWDMSQEYTDMVNELLGTALRRNNWGDWGQLTAEQMEKIRTYLPQVWTNMLEQGKYDKSDYFEQYADEAGKLEELTDQIRENLLNTSFESLRDNFIDTLMDMSSSAEDFSKNFSEMMQRALLRAAISNKFDKQIKAWYESITNDMMNADGTYKELTAQQIANYRSQWDALTNGMLAERDRIAQITGYTGDEDEDSREASQKGIAQASQDSIDELNGRATAIQSHTYEINENTCVIVNTTNVISANVAALNDSGKLLVNNSASILRSVMHIETETDGLGDRLERIENNSREIRSTVSDIALKGVKMK